MSNPPPCDGSTQFADNRSLLRTKSGQGNPPYHVEADELGLGWDSYGSTEELVEAARLASRLVRSWQIRGDERRVRILDRDGTEL